jgi:callose synthase
LFFTLIFLSISFFLQHVSTRRPKTNFVEVRTFCTYIEVLIICGCFLIWLSRYYILFPKYTNFFYPVNIQTYTLTSQAMLIVSWSSSGSLSGITDGTVFRNVLSIFITAALLNLIKGRLLFLCIPLDALGPCYVKIDMT